jgi:hypothetical protein
MDTALVAYAGLGLASGLGGAHIWAVALPREAHGRFFGCFRSTLDTAMKTDDPKVFLGAYLEFLKGLGAYFGRGSIALVASSVLVVLVACAVAKALPAGMARGEISPWPVSMPDGAFFLTLGLFAGFAAYLAVKPYLSSKLRSAAS